VEKLPSLLQSETASFKISLPAFLGMLLAGMLLANLPGKWSTVQVVIQSLICVYVCVCVYVYVYVYVVTRCAHVQDPGRLVEVHS
jgi:dolichyl-phosphate-mannose--protein O-mannosyl transferase